MSVMGIFKSATLSLAVLLTASTAGFAQETGTQETSEQTVQAGPQVGQVFVRETHGDWSVRCMKAPEGQKDPCVLFQRLLDETGNPTADIEIIPLPDGAQAAAAANFTAPLESLLPPGISMAIDGGAVKRYPFVLCAVSGCQVRIAFTKEEINAMKAGNSGEIILVPAAAPDQPVALEMSLTGFTAAISTLQGQ